MTPYVVKSGQALLWAVVVTFLIAPSVWAQQTGTISGTVTVSPGDRPLSSVQVSIPGSGIGGLTDSGGRFTLQNVPTGERIVRAQMPGYRTVNETVTVAPGQTVTISFNLAQSAIALDEVVVTGAGEATERRRLGNLIESINLTNLEDAPIRSPSEVLQARTPGVTVGRTGGLAGEGSQIRIRGSGSLSQRNDPVIYVDGVRIDNAVGYGTDNTSSRLDDINPDAIERIEILKGAAAATLYGTEASNGVIQIFTKRGQSGAPRWTLSVGGGLSSPVTSRIEPLAGFALAQGPTAGRDRGTQGIRDYWGINVQPYEVFEVDQTPFILETGRHLDTSISASGGSDFMTYSVVARRAWEDGIHGGTQFGPFEDISEFRQVDASLSLMPSENLRLELSTRYADRHHSPTHDGTPSSAISITLLSRPMLAHEGNPIGWAAFGTVREAMQIERSEDTERFGGAFTARYALTPSLNFDVTTGLDFVDQVGIEFRPFGWNVDGVAGDFTTGYREVQSRRHKEFTIDAKAHWNRALGDQFTTSWVLGSQTLIGNTQTVTARGQQFPGPGLEVVGAGVVQNNIESFLKTVNTGVFAQGQLGFQDYLFTTVGLRVDRHSAFGEDAGAATYPKVGLSFVPSDMPGWMGFGPASTLRFRAAIGQSGLQPGAFDRFTTFRPLGAVTGAGLEPDNLGNPALQPEVSTEWEGGVDLGLLDDRFSVEATYWNRTTSDLLVPRQFQPSGGFLNPQLDNIGEMTAWGVDIGVNGLVYSTPRMSIDMFANASFLSEMITDMGGAPPITFGIRRLQRIVEGYAPNALFGGRLVDAQYPFDVTGNGQPNSVDELLQWFSQARTPEQVEARTVGMRADDGTLTGHYLGKASPDWTGAFGTNVAFSNFSIASVFQYAGGNYGVTNHTAAFRHTNASIGRNTRPAAEADATLLNPASTAEERLEAARWFAENGFGLGQFNGLNQVEPGDFLRWGELSVTYRVPQELAGRLGADAVSLTAAGRNLMLWTKFSGIDPEVTVGSRDVVMSGHQAHKIGIPRRFSLSARVNF